MGLLFPVFKALLIVRRYDLLGRVLVFCKTFNHVVAGSIPARLTNISGTVNLTLRRTPNLAPESVSFWGSTVPAFKPLMKNAEGTRRRSPSPLPK